jgi:CRISPR-associated protein (TIGR02710 family)
MYQDPSLAELDDAAFAAEADRRIEALKAGTTAEKAKTLYEEQVLPCEAERLRREAERRKAEGEEPLDLLFVTVGAQPDSPALAIIASPARFVVLLHTEKERGQAETVVERLALSANSATLRSIGDGTRILDLYKVCFEEWRNRGRPRRVAFDLTGGLKTMSAAAAAAGFAIPGGSVFYVEADQPRIHGKIFSVNERRITLDNPLVVFGEIRRESARALLARGAYAAAAESFAELYRQTSQPADDLRARLAQGYAAFDTLDFRKAEEVLARLADDLAARERDRPTLRTDAVVVGRAQVRANAEGAKILAGFVEPIGRGNDPVRERTASVKDACRDFIAMLLEVADRRRAAAEYDAAALLAYRASEAVVQRRLALRGGIDPSAVDWQRLAKNAHPRVEDLVRCYNKITNKDYHLEVSSLPSRLGRAQAFALLAVAFPDDVAKENDVNKFAGLGEARNRSLLAHGLSALNRDTTESLIEDTEALFTTMLNIEAVAPADQSALRRRYQFLEVKGETADDPR